MEALAFKEAAGYAGSLFFLPLAFSESPMRAFIIVAGAAALAGCGNNDQTDNTANVDDNLTAENIVSNDVTAIDAVTGDAANMAADVNYANLVDNSLDNSANVQAPAAARKPAARPSAEPAQPAENTAAPSPANSTE